MFQNAAIRPTLTIVLALIVAIGTAGAQPSDLAEVNANLRTLREERAGLEAKLRQLRDGDERGALGGSFNKTDGMFDTFFLKPDVATGIEIPLLPQRYIDYMATTLWSARAQYELAKKAFEDLPANATEEQVRDKLILLGAARQELNEARATVRRAASTLVQGASLRNTREVREGILRAATEFGTRLTEVNAEIARLEARRARLTGVRLTETNSVFLGPIDIVGALVVPSTTLPPLGSGTAKLSNGDTGTFTITGVDNKTRVAVDMGPIKITAIGGTYDPKTKILPLQWEMKLPKDLFGGITIRGSGKLDYAAKTFTTTSVDEFLKDGAWVKAGKDVDAFRETYRLQWRDDSPSLDRGKD